MSRWILVVACAAACTRPADREKPAPNDAAKTTAIDAPVDAEVAPDARAPTIAPTIPTVPTVPTAALAAGDSKVLAVEMSGRTACARRADGAVRCWGSANAREVGSVVPYDITGAPEAAAFHLAHGVLAIVTRGGDIAIGPLAVPAQPKLELVSVGEAIDVRVDAARRAWALTRTGDVHRIDGTTTSRAVINVVALSSREAESTDALHRDGTVTTLTRGKAVPVKGITDAETLFATRCAHRKSGGVACWNTRGKIVPWKGPSSTIDRRSAGGVTCTLAGSNVACAGRNDAGQLGTGPGDDRSDGKVLDLPGKAVAIAGGDRTWCAVLDAGALACWGANDSGQLGDGTLIDRFTAVVITGAASAKAPAAVAVEDAAVDEAGAEMSWHDLPKGCTQPTTIPRPGGAPVNVVSAYAVIRARGTELWFADFKLVQGGYPRGHVVARGKQMAVVYAIGGKKIDRGRYRGTRGDRTGTVALGTAGAPPPSPADVLVEKVDGGWICGTILDPADAKKRTPFAALGAKPRFE